MNFSDILKTMVALGYVSSKFEKAFHFDLFNPSVADERVGAFCARLEHMFQTDAWERRQKLKIVRAQDRKRLIVADKEDLINIDEEAIGSIYANREAVRYNELVFEDLCLDKLLKKLWAEKPPSFKEGLRTIPSDFDLLFKDCNVDEKAIALALSWATKGLGFAHCDLDVNDVYPNGVLSMSRLPEMTIAVAVV